MAKAVKKQVKTDATPKAAEVKKYEYKPGDPMTDAIKAYLDQRAIDDELFAVTYAKPNKNLGDCVLYIYDQAQQMAKEGMLGLPDDTVYNLAVHYYDEDDIKIKGGSRPKVIVNHVVELSDEQKEEARKKAIENVTKDYEKEAKEELKATVELTPEELAEAKQIALGKAVEQATAKMLEKKKKPAMNVVHKAEAPKAEEKPKAKTATAATAEVIVDEKGQGSLF